MGKVGETGTTTTAGATAQAGTTTAVAATTAVAVTMGKVGETGKIRALQVTRTTRWEFHQPGEGIPLRICLQRGPVCLPPLTHSRVLLLAWAWQIGRAHV